MADKLNFTEKDYYTKDESDVKYIGTTETVEDSNKLGGHDVTYFAPISAVYAKSEADLTFLGINDKAKDSEKFDGYDVTYFALASDTYTKNEVYNKSETYTKTETDQAISDFVNSSPNALQTLNDLEDALNDSTNFATVCITQLSQKLDIVDFNGNNILTKLKTVDGPGSGLDADTVDGYHALENSTGYDLSIPVRTANGEINIGKTIYFHSNPFDPNPSVTIDNTASDILNITGLRSDGLKANGNTVWTSQNHGPGSGLDADTIHGISSDEISLKSHTYTKDEVWNKSESYSKSETYSREEAYNKNEVYSKRECDILFVAKDVGGLNATYLGGYDSTYYAKVHETYTKNEIDDLLDDKIDDLDLQPIDFLNKVKIVDGEGSGLDADVVRGQVMGSIATKNEFISSSTPSGRNDGDIWFQI